MIYFCKTGLLKILGSGVYLYIKKSGNIIPLHPIIHPFCNGYPRADYAKNDFNNIYFSPFKILTIIYKTRKKIE